MSGSARTRAPSRPRGPRTRKTARRWPAPGTRARRWLFILGFTLALLVGLPLAHALVGDVGAILVGTFVLGFALGRMTIPR